MTDKLEEISHEDKRFLKIMNEQTIKVSNHYQSPLPLQNPPMILPNNQKMVEERAQYLKQRFERDPKYYQHYKTFMDEIISKGYAKQSGNTSQNGRVWHLLLHEVYYPLKPEKIRVVFDCSSGYRRRSIHKELLAGPDLPNQTVGTLIKFRQDKVADIQNMFFQVYVSNEHWSYYSFCGGRKVVFPDNLLIMVCVFMFLVAPHPHLVVIMLLKELQLMEQISLERKLLRPCRIIFMLMTF